MKSKIVQNTYKTNSIKTWLPALLLIGFTHSAQANVNLISGAFEKDWKDQVTNSTGQSYTVTRSYNSKSGWSFEIPKEIKNKDILRSPQGQILKILDHQYEYQNHLLVAVTHAKQKTQFIYNTNEKLIEIKDKNSTQISISYDKNFDRVTHLHNTCLEEFTYSEQITGARYELRTEIRTQCKNQRPLSRAYKFVFHPTEQGWNLQSAWQVDIKGGRLGSL